MPNAGGETLRRLCVYNGGFLRQQRLRRILKLAGWRISLGLPRGDDHVGVWGQSPYAKRGEAVAARCGAPLLRVEDGFLRSLRPGRDGEPPIGLLLDRAGVHFDARVPSDLETLLRTHPLDDHALLERARGAIARMREGHLTKYAAVDPALPAPEPGYVLVVDQTAGDASVIASGADRNRFREMLYWAREEHPGKRILLRSHPETQAGHRKGHFRKGDCGGLVSMHSDPVSPWALLEGAVAVYTVSSQMGFEAILAGHRPRVFGTPFYAGWGLSDDEGPIARRQRRLTRTQLFAAAMILYPTWYDPCRDRLCQLEEVLAQLEAQTRAWREDRHGWVATGMRLWKRKHLQQFFGSVQPVRFARSAREARAKADVDPASGNTPPRLMAWATAAEDTQAVRVEDGFLRSRGLGAELTPPLSLVCDPMGIYYDPTRPSTLERLIADSPLLRPDALLRAERLAARLMADGLTKYNLTGALPALPDGHRILVPGQVEDDASIRLGSPQMTSNAALLERVRAENSGAVILWKPHPDVLAGLRPGAVERPEQWADLTVDGDMAALLGQVHDVWTMTSLTGFEALLRGVPVTTLGAPFYAGWGLTRDLGPVPARRLHGPRPSLLGLVHATLIAYPRYRDPVTGLPCPAEVVADRLAAGTLRSGPGNRALSKLQGLLASRAGLWRR